MSPGLVVMSMIGVKAPPMIGVMEPPGNGEFGFRSGHVVCALQPPFQRIFPVIGVGDLGTDSYCHRGWRVRRGV